MKKLIPLMIGLGLVLSITAPSLFAQEKTQSTKKTKKSKTKKETTKKGGSSL